MIIGAAPRYGGCVVGLLRNQLCAGIVDVPEYGVRGKRGDFDPLISEHLFYRVQSLLFGE